MGTSPYKRQTLPQNLIEGHQSVFTAKQQKVLMKRFQRLAEQRSGTMASSAFLSMPEIVVLPLTRFIVPWFEFDSAVRGAGTGVSGTAAAIAPLSDAGGEHGRAEAGASQRRSTTMTANDCAASAMSSSGMLTLDGYMQLLAFLSPQTSAQRKHRAMFELLDAEGSGLVGLPELEAGLAAIVGSTLPQGAVREAAASCLARGLSTAGTQPHQERKQQEQQDVGVKIDRIIDYEGFLRAVPLPQAARHLTVALF